MLLGRAVKEHLFFEKVRVRVRVRSSKIEVRCASACETIIEVRVCVRHTVKFLATQHLKIYKNQPVTIRSETKDPVSLITP